VFVLMLVAQQNGSLEDRARTVVKEFLSGHQDAVIAMIKSSPPPEASLTQARDQIIKNLGNFQAVARVTTGPFRGLQLSTVVCTFDNGTAELGVTFDSKGEMAGLRLLSMRPVEIDWVAPTYAKSNGFSEQELKLGAAPWELTAVLTTPKGTGPFPAVILVHGPGPHDKDETFQNNKPFKDLAWGLASNGIAVLRYDKRTFTYGREMAPLKLTVMDETIDDARAAITLLEKNPSIDPKKIYLIGHSLGGMLAPRIATGTSLAGIVIMAGNIRPLEDVLLEQTEHMRDDGLATEEAVQSMREARIYVNGNLEPSTTVVVAGAPTPGSYWLDLRKYSPAEAAKALKIPMFVIQGDRDYQIGKADYEGWQRALKDRQDVKFKMYPSLNHLFIAGSGPASSREYTIPGHIEPTVVQDIATWIKTGK
jgi:dienelactone hydrolase